MLGTHIHMNTTCFPTDVCEENMNKLKHLLFECEVISHQTTSGHNTKKQNAGNTIHTIEMSNTSEIFMSLSIHSNLAFSSIGDKSLYATIGV